MNSFRCLLITELLIYHVEEILQHMFNQQVLTCLFSEMFSL